jgi:superfamily I DNA/RNA helicase
MRVLRLTTPTAEQLPVLNYRPGFVVIRGSVGSGKTSTAVFRLRVVTGVWTRQRERTGDTTPVRALVLTFNRALRGYIEELVRYELADEPVDLTLSTFARWAVSLLGPAKIVNDQTRAIKLWGLGQGLGYPEQFLLDEVAYVLGRYLPENLGQYIDPTASTYERTGRGSTPRVERPMRVRILDEVIRPYTAWKEENGWVDWGDLGVAMVRRVPTDRYDIVLVDEAQDFSGNQVRGLVNHLSEEHSTAFVLDAVQRIYPHGFESWAEVGVVIPPENSFRLEENHRNTREIAAFARPLVAGLPVDPDGTLPDLNTCTRHGPLPKVVRGRFADQATWLLEYIASLPEEQSVALLHPKGGGYFDYIRGRLTEAGIPYAEMQAQAEWPQGQERVGLSTLASAKGLEFDHVVVLGLNGELVPNGLEEDDIQLEQLRRRVAVAITRARETATLTYKPEDPPQLADYLDPATFDTVDL